MQELSATRSSAVTMAPRTFIAALLVSGLTIEVQTYSTYGPLKLRAIAGITPHQRLTAGAERVPASMSSRPALSHYYAT